jgi:hypothetical protein
VPTPYEAQFREGIQIRINDKESLERFAREWQYHNPLTREQMQFAGVVATIVGIGFYHGGDPLYTLENVPGVWHEECLGTP